MNNSVLPVACPKCSSRYRVAADRVGKSVTCGSCKHQFLVMAPSSSPASSGSAPAQQISTATASVATTGPLAAESIASCGSPSSGGKSSAKVSRVSQDRFEVLEELGAGAYGTVYKAHDTQLDRLVALKIPKLGAMGSASNGDQFLREARAAGNLRHPHIVPIYDAGLIGEDYFIASGFIDGETLEAKLQGGKTMPPREAALLIQKLAAALHYAHSKGIVHRDVKPGNVMIDTDGEPLIMDFGLARREEGDTLQTQEGHYLGTPAYMSPEQHSGESATADERVDQWALGVMLYEMLTGVRPFQGHNPLQLAYAVRETVPEQPGKVNKLIDRDLEAICLKTIRKAVGERYSSCLELGEELGRWLRWEPIAARPLSMFQRMWRWCRRKPGAASSLAAIATSILVGAAVSLAFGVSSVRSASELKTALGLQKLETARAERERLAAEQARQLGQSALEFQQRETARAEQERIAANAARELGRRYLYSAHMNLVQSAWESGNEGQAVRLLDLYRPKPVSTKEDSDLRGFEWHYWRQLANNQVLSMTGHAKRIICVAYSSNGNFIASGSEDHSIIVWNSSTGERVATLQGHDSPVQSISFSSDSHRLATASQDGVAKIWDVLTGEVVLTLKAETYGYDRIAYSPNGKQLVTASGDNRIVLWDALSGGEIRTLGKAGSSISGLAYSPDGKHVSSVGPKGNIQLWKAAASEQSPALDEKVDGAFGVAFSRNGNWLATGTFDGSVIIWDTYTGKRVHTLKGHKGPVLGVDFSPQEDLLASTSTDNSVKIWNCDTGVATLTFAGHTGIVFGVDFSPDGKRVVSASDDLTLRVWELSRSKTAITFEDREGIVMGVAFSPDGRHVASVDDRRRVRVWSSATGRETTLFEGGSSDQVMASIVFSPDGRHLACTTDLSTIAMVELRTGKIARLLEGHESNVNRLAFSSDGGILASASSDDSVIVWDVAKGSAEWKSRLHSGGAQGVALSRDGKLICSSGQDDIIRVRDLATRSEILALSGHSEIITDVAFSPDGRQIASSGFDSTVRVWDSTTGKESLKLVGHGGIVSCVAFSPDGQRLATGSWDNTIKLWAADTGQETLTIRGHSGPVMSLAFSPDGMRLISGGFDKKLKMWSATSAPLMVGNETPNAGETEYLFPGEGFTGKLVTERRRAWADSLQKAEVTRNSIGMDLILIPPGVGRISDNSGKTISIEQPFYIGIYEVTQAEYSAIVKMNPSAFSSEGGLRDRVREVSTQKFPVEHVTFVDAVDFCNRLSASEALPEYYRIESKTPPMITIAGGNGYRLPSVAEWRYAASTGDELKWKLTSEQWSKYAWCDKDADGMVHAVGGKLSNWFGLRDVWGNVWEYCGDNGEFRGTAYGAPADEFKPGFGFNNGLENRASDIGFRVARSL